MKIVIASKSPVKENAVRSGVNILFPDNEIIYECVSADSGVSSQPMSDEETRTGALGRIKHAKELVPDADIYIALEGGSADAYGDLHCFGWVVAESEGKQGFGRTFSFVIPPGIHELMVKQKLELSSAVDAFFLQSGTKTGTGLIGALTENKVTYADWYEHAVVSALLPFLRKELY